MRHVLLPKLLFMKIKIYLIGLLASFVFISCEKESMQKAVQVHQDVSAENGMLSFRNHSVFLDKILEWNELSLEDVNAIIRQFNFRSYALDTLIDRTDLINPDPLIRRVLNHEGAIKVGDSIFVFNDRGEEVIIKNGDENLYNKVLSGAFDRDDRNIQVNKVKIEARQILQNSNELSPMSQTPGTWYGETQVFSPEEYFGRPERAKIIVYAQSSGLYPSAGVTAIGEAYRSGGVFGSKKWRNDEIHALSFHLHLSTDNFGQTYSNLPVVTFIDHEEIKLISSISGTHPTTGEHLGWKHLDFTLELRKNSGSPALPYRMYYTIASGVQQPIIKNW